MTPRALPLTVLALAFSTVWASAQTLPGTQPLEANPDFSATMVAGIDKMALRLIEESKATRKPTRDKLKAAIGLVDERMPIKALEFIGDTESPALLMETDLCRVFRVRWPVFHNVHGEGLYIQPKSKPHARVVYMPDASSTPEKLVDEFLLTTGCEIVIPALVSRESTCSTNDKFNVKTNLAHREWIYRQSYELGRHTSLVMKCRRRSPWWTGSKHSRTRCRCSWQALVKVGCWRCMLQRSMSASTASTPPVTSHRVKVCGRSRSIAMSSVSCAI
jgi:hypothetical protein